MIKVSSKYNVQTIIAILAIIIVPALVFGQLHRWSGFDIDQLKVQGEAEFEDSVTFEDDVVVEGKLTVEDTLIIDAPAEFAGDVQIDSTLTVGGDVTFSESATFSESVTLSGGFSIDSITTGTDSIFIWHSDTAYAIPAR